MAPTGASPVFIDTNILIYSTFAASPLYASARARLRDFESGGARMWISRQVLREYLAATTRVGIIIPDPPHEILIDAVHEFESRFKIADDHADVTAALMELVRTHKVRGKQIHDANIAATMCCHNIRYLLTNNPVDFLRYEPRITVLPLCS
jgi:predicted nucleic acid-binding protein